jgi:hypothetical protein
MGPAAFAAQVPVPAYNFVISADNVTMPSSGVVAVPFTLTSANFAGTVAVLCAAPTAVAGVKAPYCEDYGPARVFTLTSNGTATGTFEVVAKQPQAVPVVSGLDRSRPGIEASWAMAGALMLGIRLRRNKTHRISRLSLAIGMIAALAGMGLCGCGGPPTLTPGAYVFTFNAKSVSDTNNVSLSSSTTATVTVPSGIVTMSNN